MSPCRAGAARQEGTMLLPWRPEDRTADFGLSDPVVHAVGWKPRRQRRGAQDMVDAPNREHTSSRDDRAVLPIVTPHEAQACVRTVQFGEVGTAGLEIRIEPAVVDADAH